MRGIITDIQKGRAVILRKDGRFVEIKDHHYTLGQTIKIPTQPYVKYIAMAACFFLLFTTGVSAHHLYYTPTSYIYIDINPSLRLDINRFNQVISVVPLNSVAEDLTKSTSLKNSEAETCIQNIVSACQKEKYLNDSNTDVKIDIVTSNSDLANTVDTVSRHLKKDDLLVYVTPVDASENRKALQLKISTEKLKAVEQYTKTYGNSLESNAKKLSHLSTDTIYETLKTAKSTAEKSENASAQTDASAAATVSEAAANSTTQTPKKQQPQQKPLQKRTRYLLCQRLAMVKRWHNPAALPKKPQQKQRKVLRKKVKPQKAAHRLLSPKIIRLLKTAPRKVARQKLTRQLPIKPQKILPLIKRRPPIPPKRKTILRQKTRRQLLVKTKLPPKIIPIHRAHLIQKKKQRAKNLSIPIKYYFDFIPRQSHGLSQKSRLIH